MNLWCCFVQARAHDCLDRDEHVIGITKDMPWATEGWSKKILKNVYVIVLEMTVESEEEAKYLTMPEQLKDKFIPLYFLPFCMKEKNEEERYLTIRSILLLSYRSL